MKRHNLGRRVAHAHNISNCAIEAEEQSPSAFVILFGFFSQQSLLEGKDFAFDCDIDSKAVKSSAIHKPMERLCGEGNSRNETVLCDPALLHLRDRIIP